MATTTVDIAVAITVVSTPVTPHIASVLFVPFGPGSEAAAGVPLTLPVIMSASIGGAGVTALDILL